MAAFLTGAATCASSAYALYASVEYTHYSDITYDLTRLALATSVDIACEILVCNLPILYRLGTHLAPKVLSIASGAKSSARYSPRSGYGSSSIPPSEFKIPRARINQGLYCDKALPPTPRALWSSSTSVAEDSAKHIVTSDGQSNDDREEARSDLLTKEELAKREKNTFDTSQGESSWARFDAASVEENGRWPEAYELEATSRAAVIELAAG
ncbi:hypothetical protein MMC25_006952 [Agyrium rufum]|nr:hypothetical protein [Agyrium rufum]